MANLMLVVREVLAAEHLDAEGRITVALRLIDTLGPDEDAPTSADGGVPEPDRPRVPAPPKKSRKKSAKRASKSSPATPRGSKTSESTTRVQQVLDALESLGGRAAVDEIGRSMGLTGKAKKPISVTLFNLVQSGRVRKLERGVYALP